MQAIWKFKIEPNDHVQIAMPKGAKILCLQVQNEIPCIWAVCDMSAKREQRTFNIYGTGHQHENIDGKYVGTFQLTGGSFVFHVFEVFGICGVSNSLKEI